MKLIFLLIFISLNSYADLHDCPRPDERAISSLEKTLKSCEVQKKLATEPAVQDKHRKLIYDELAKKLATQIKQNSEELSVLTNFSNAKNANFMLGNDTAKSQCKLENLKTIESCNTKSNSHQERFSLLKKYLPQNKNTPFFDNTKSTQDLYGLVAGKFYSDLGLSGVKNMHQCPLNQETGSFPLQGQLDDLSANYIVTQFKDPLAEKNKLYNQYAQLKIIKNSENSEFIKSFESYLKNMPAGSDANEYITNFFKKKENQEILANTVAKKCEQMNKNINTFLCESDLKELGSLNNETSISLFHSLNTEQLLENQEDAEIDKPGVLTAYGMQCLVKDKLLAAKKNNIPLNLESSVDQWFADFSKQERPELSQSSINQSVKNFCAFYNCEEEKAKTTNSCIKGGPLSSNDLKIISDCNTKPFGQNCSQVSLQSIKYLENIEKLQNDSSKNTASNNKNTSSKKTGKLPAFAENFFGAEGTLKALGQEVTPITIAERKKDIEEYKPAPTTSPSTITATPAVATQRPTTQASSSNSSESNSYESSASTSTTPQYNPTSASIAATNSNYKVASAVKADAKSGAAKAVISADTTSESSNLRAQMEDMIKDLKNEKSANEAETSANAVQGTGASAQKSKAAKTIVNNNGDASISSREEALNRRQRSLDNRSDELDQYKNELDRRAAGTPSDRSVAQDGVSPTGNGTGSGTSKSNSGASDGGAQGPTLSTARLSAAGGKGDPKSNTAAIIQSGKETSAITVEQLETLSPENLKSLGIDSTKPFTLRVNYNSKVYEVPVKAVVYKGNNILGPVIDPKNKDLKELLLKSPLFKSYRDYRTERGTLDI
jgi:hypothetical protein